MMPLSEILFLAIVLYLLYRFIQFLLPIIRATRQIREQFKNMQDHVNNTSRPGERQTNTFSGNTASQSGSSKQQPEGKTPVGEYIDFEEIK